MAKTLLEFENEIVDIYHIIRINKRNIFNDKSGEMEYCVLINDSIPENSSSINNLKFPFSTEELRDSKYKKLKTKVSELENVNII